MTQLLMTIPSQLTPDLHGRPAHARRSKIREIMEYVDENPGAELSTADLAAMAGISARALQAGFQDVVGMSPTAYVRGVRLDRVRFELEAGVSRSVTDAAARWGFFHPGRFARQYRNGSGCCRPGRRGHGELELNRQHKNFELEQGRAGMAAPRRAAAVSRRSRSRFDGTGLAAGRPGLPGG